MGETALKSSFIIYIYNPGQNVLGHLRKLGTKTHFAKLTHILPLKKAWGCCYKGLFLLSPSPPSSVDCVELKLEYITSTLHRGGRGEGRCLNLTSYCVSVPRVLTRVVVVSLFGVKQPCASRTNDKALGGVVLRGTLTSIKRFYHTRSFLRVKC